MSFEEKNADDINLYLEQARSTAHTGQYKDIDWGNKKEKYEILKIPLELLTYSFNNVRILSELKKEQKKSGFLDFENEDDRIKFANKFEKWLTGTPTRKKHTKELTDDIIRIGQKEAGIITYGGVIIDGNRRFMVLKRISQSVKPEKIPNVETGFMYVIRLKEGTSPKKLLELQTRIQMAKKIFEPYSPINVLLGIQNLRNNGFSESEIAKMMNLSKKNIQDKIDQLRLIDDFLEKTNHKFDYEYVQSEKLSPDHFDELRKMEAAFDKRADLGATQIVKSKKLLRKTAFKLYEFNIDPEMIKMGLTIGSREQIRPLKEVIADQRNHTKIENLLKLGKNKKEKKEFYEQMQAQIFIIRERKSDYVVITIANQIIKKIKDIQLALMDPHQDYDFKKLLKLIKEAGTELVKLKKEVEVKIK